MTTDSSNKDCAVVIGRNEGERLIRCLDSLKGQIDTIVYVDSGSSDNSVPNAHNFGAHVVQLDPAEPFTAARARNAGIKKLRELDHKWEYVQFIDADCIMRSNWLHDARRVISKDEDIAVVCGRRREQYPNKSTWNRLIDIEWNTPIGDVQACGGDSLMRWSALESVGGFRSSLIAGEEPELCFRLRALGWRVCRIEAEMTLHDAAIHRIVQWYKRSKRAGYAFAEVSTLHRRSPEKMWVSETYRSVFWGFFLPLAILFVCFTSIIFCFILFSIYPLQLIRLRLGGFDWPHAFFTLLGKFPEAIGVIEYMIVHVLGRRRSIIEYK